MAGKKAKNKKRYVPTVEEVIKAGYQPDAAERVVAREQAESDEEVLDLTAPSFTLRADSPFGHAALVMLWHNRIALPVCDSEADLAAMVREFELYEDACRAVDEAVEVPAAEMPAAEVPATEAAPAAEAPAVAALTEASAE